MEAYGLGQMDILTNACSRRSRLSSRRLGVPLGILAIAFVTGCATYRPLSPTAFGYRETNSAALCDSLPSGAPIEVTLKSGRHVIGALAAVDANSIVVTRGGAKSRVKTVFARADIAAVATAAGQSEFAYSAATAMLLLAAFVGAIGWSMAAGGGS